jgi:CheY-like chemotaxis protein
VELPFKSPSNATLGTKVERPVQRSEEPQQRPGLQLPLRTPLRVLLVEDNFTNQMVARLLLLKLGAEVSTANDGEEGLSALEHGKFDLVLMDCQMPVLDGLEATRRLREQGHRIPVIAVTANASTTDEENCRASGMDGYLSKPYTLEGLHAELLRHIPVELLTPYDPDVLQDLAVKLSPQAAREVWLSYLSTLTALAPVAPSAEELTVLQRLGHKFKSSSRTVGAFKLAVICERLEEASSLTEARKWFSALGDAREELLNLDINIFTGAPHEHDGKESSYS